jgi:hypothetical protein
MTKAAPYQRKCFRVGEGRVCIARLDAERLRKVALDARIMNDIWNRKQLTRDVYTRMYTRVDVIDYLPLRILDIYKSTRHLISCAFTTTYY